jgi:hypothetical protein
MHPTGSVENMLSALEYAFRTRYTSKDVNLTGIVFARPTNRFARREILPHINYWHVRSGRATDLFFPGYADKYHDLSYRYEDFKNATEVDGQKWYFSDHAFADVVQEIESRSSWRYSGGTELIIVNARFGARTYANGKIREGASLDLSSAIAIDLESAAKDKAFRDVTELIEGLFEFCNNLNTAEDNPCWAFSDRHGFRIVKSSLKEWLIDWLPKALRPEAKKAFYFAARDISPKLT